MSACEVLYNIPSGCLSCFFDFTVSRHDCSLMASSHRVFHWSIVSLQVIHFPRFGFRLPPPVARF